MNLFYTGVVEPYLNNVVSVCSSWFIIGSGKRIGITGGITGQNRYNRGLC